MTSTKMKTEDHHFLLENQNDDLKKKEEDKKMEADLKKNYDDATAE
jgi:hypothetical protein